MQEFSSISVSSYDAGTLAERLTEQSADGWGVVAIVPTGSTITAYLSRDGGAAAAPIATPAVAAPADDDTASTSTGEAAPGDGGGEHDPQDATPGTHDDAATTTPEPVTEAPGWAAGGTTSDTAASHPMPEAASSPSVESTPSPSTHESTPESTTPSTATPQPTEAGAAPAGWYADPSSRFELRYWDGGQWTEHVSRGGQQYTDPPVA